VLPEGDGNMRFQRIEQPEPLPYLTQCDNGSENRKKAVELFQGSPIKGIERLVRSPLFSLSG
jgi:hypothetical protein